jgi:hypothetical protein
LKASTSKETRLFLSGADIVSFIFGVVNALDV